MTDRDERLSAELQEYYRRMAQQPAPDVTGRVMMAATAPAARMRLWAAIGGGVLAAGAVTAVVAVALLNHHPATVPAPAQTPTPSASPVAVGPTPTPLPSQQPVVGPAVHGFVSTDVTAISASQWWVLGYNGPSCSSASCTRILHTTDAGASFTSISVPPVAPDQGSAQPVRLRFADPADGWVVSGTGLVWETHDAGVHWTQDPGISSVTDLEASNGEVFAITCVPAPNCVMRRSPAGRDSWSTLTASAGHGYLGRLNVNGVHVWASIESSAGGPGSLITSADGGQHFSVQVMCPSALGYPDVYAVSSSVLWGTCATGTAAGVVRSVDGGQHFGAIPGPIPSIPNLATIAGVSSSTAVIGGGSLLRTTDSGQTFTTVEDNQTQWTVLGFTTAVNGFAFDLLTSGQTALWRTNDTGAHWYQVQFP